MVVLQNEDSRTPVGWLGVQRGGFMKRDGFRHRFAVRVAVLVFASLAATSCGDRGEARGERPGPALVPLDSIRLAEADTLYIGSPYTPVIDPYDGTIYVPDIFSRRVHRFARD